MVARWLIILIIAFTPVVSALSQITHHYDSGFTYREVVDAICDDPDNMCHYFKSVSWNDSQIKEYTYRGMQGVNVVEFMNWRMVFPAGYDKNREQGYPIIMMLHGGGESGRKWGGTTFLPTENRFDNNGYNVIHGGQAHLNAVNRNPNLSNAFPGIVLWPQVSYNGAWESGWENGNLSANAAMTAGILEWVIENYNVDPDRVAVHGLSNGAKGSWDIAAKRPDLFAAVLPMSGVGSNLAPMVDALVTMPLWLFQGGTDTNPRQQAAEDWIAAMLAAGGAPRYTLYPTLGHGTWNTAYAEPDFFPWILSQSKKNIYVYGGDPSICPGGALKLGFSANMLEYQWVKDNEDIPGANTRFLTTAIDGIGTYKVKYKRRFGPDVWIESNPIQVLAKTSSSFTPVISSTGSTNLTIDIGGVQNIITLTANTGYNEYRWFKNGGVNPIITTSTNSYSFSNNNGSATDAGTYTVKIKEQTGCLTEASNGIVVRYFATQPNTPSVTAPTVPSPSSSPTEMLVTWPDYASEVKYELWRFRFGYGSLGYPEQLPKLIAILPAGTTSYLDKGLRPEALYKYRIRAILSSGQAVFSPESQWGTTNTDNIPPTAPSNLIATNITDTGATLSWEPSSDNDLIYKYEIYNGANLLATITGNIDGNPLPATTYAVTGLEPNTTNLLNVRAIDFRNNYSPFADGVSVSTQGLFGSGLDYKFYRYTGNMPGTAGAQMLEPQQNNSFNFGQNPLMTGTRNNFGINNTNPPDGGSKDRYVFAMDGYIEILTAGVYTFYAASDDGSRLYISTSSPLVANSESLVVNNDGTHGNSEVSGIYTFNAPGKYPIRVTYFEQTGGSEILTVSYAGPGITKTAIPNNRLYRSIGFPTYYLRTGTDDPSLNTSWTSNSNGVGGTSPAATAFTNSNTYFVLANRDIVNLNFNWSVSGSGSKIIAGNGLDPIEVNANAIIDGLVEASNNSTINLFNTTLPRFGQLHSSSNVNFNIAGTVGIPSGNYGNVHLSAAQYNLPLSNTSVLGNLAIDNGVTTSGAANNLSTLRIGGDLTINNTSGNPFPANGPNQYSLVFTGSNTHTVSFINPVDPNLFSIQADFGDVVNFTGLTGRTITVGSAQGGGLTLKGGAKLNLGNNNLVVSSRGTINNNNETGALSMTGGDLTLTTTATQNSSLYFSAGDSVRNVTISTPAANRAAILTSLKVNNLVTVNNGELNAGEGYLVLRSLSDAANGTARIGPLLNGAKITGKINAQRYMSGEGRIYRYISSPVKGVTVATLQSYFPITGNFPGASTGTGLSASPSMFHYAETSDPQYQPFPTPVTGSVLDTLKRGKGYVPFIREASAPTVMSLIGEPYQGTQAFVLTGTNGVGDTGWNLLGNPYPAPIKWTGSSTGGWAISGVSSTAYIRENSEGTTLVKSHDGTSGTNGWDGVIAPGQAFWVRTTSLTPTLTVNENAKHTVDGAFYREGAPDNTLEIVMKSATAQDAALIRFVDGAATPAFDTNIDGVKQENSFFNLSTLTADNKALVINLTTTNFCEQEIKLRTTNAAVGTYELNINGVSSLISGETVTFYDHFTQTEKVISESEVYPFSITADAASKADGRFTLKFGKPEVILNQTLKTDAVCDQASPVINIINSQPGVTYQAFHNGAAISQGLTSAGGTLELAVDPSLVALGSTTATIKAGFKGCNSFELPMNIAVQRDTLAAPEIIVKPLQLMASQENANYQWYFNNEAIDGQTGRELLAPIDGLYFVEVTLGSCSKTSDTISYVVTALEKPARANQVYPNPTRDRISVTLEEPINFSTLRVLSAVGQVLSAPTTRLSAESAEIDFSQLPVGLYVLQVNGYRYRILKE